MLVSAELILEDQIFMRTTVALIEADRAFVVGDIVFSGRDILWKLWSVFAINFKWKYQVVSHLPRAMSDFNGKMI